MHVAIALALLCLTSPAPGFAPGAEPRVAQLARNLEQVEYAFARLDGESAVWSAPNRSQELRSRVSIDGLEVFPRATCADGVGAEWKLRLRTTSFGRVGDVRALGLASVSTSGARAELEHGLLNEWFENGARGIEHGYTIAERPRGDASLRIGLHFGGDLSLRIDDDQRSGVLVDASGEARMRYRDLVVFDASGRELCARLAPSANGVGIEIDDAGAIYPLTVDPLLTGPAWTAESDQTGAEFGACVAAAGDVNGDGYSDVIVGARMYDNGATDEGRAFVYLGTASGLATTAAWTAEGDQANALFGVSVATAGDVNGDGYSDVIVGTYAYDNGETDEGRAFVYLGSAGGLATSAAWTAESNQASAHFGASVATAGDVNGDGYSDVIVGAFMYDNGQSDEGRAFVYLGSSGGLAASAAWTAESNQLGALFGHHVGAAGDVNGDGYGDVSVGANFFDNGQADEGRAFVYLGSALGLASSAAWTAESDQPGGDFGGLVGTAGDVNGDGYGDVVVAALYYDNGQTDEGRAYLYLGSASGPASSPAWTAEGDQASALFGYSASTAGDLNGDGFGDVIVGAPYHDNGQSNEGRVYVYLGTAGGLEPSAAWTIESDQSGALLGFSNTTAGDVDGDGYGDVLAGAAYYDNGEADEGRAFLYRGSAHGLAITRAWSAEGDQPFANYANSVATAGDVNGDGYSDVIVGQPGYDAAFNNHGRALVYLGSETGLASTAAWTVIGSEATDWLGVTVATAGDVNGDGYSDVIVAQQYPNPTIVFLGSVSGLATTPAWTAPSVSASQVATAGDVNGDGYADVILAAPTLAGTGVSYVYNGSAAGLANAPAWTAWSFQPGAHFGDGVASAGDVNGDGYSDVIVGASRYDNGQDAEGRAFVYMGSANGLATAPAWTAESNWADANFGQSVASAGDVNGDGFSDVIVGAWTYGNTLQGRAFVYLGSSSGLAPNPAWTAESGANDARFGVSVASAGDVNGDGYSDVIVGADRYDTDLTHEGGAFVYFGSATGLASSPAWVVEGDNDGAMLGYSVATAGDVDGDGYSDVIVGAPLYDGATWVGGAAFVYMGNDGRGGWTRAPQQRQASGAVPISLLCASNSTTGFRIRLGFERALAGFNWATGRDPTARLEWEIAHVREAFDGDGLETGAEQTINGLPLDFDEFVEFANPAFVPVPFGQGQQVGAGVFHWRARLRTNNPLFPVTPWVSIPWNNVTEAKLRVGPSPAKRVPR